MASLDYQDPDQQLKPVPPPSIAAYVPPLNLTAQPTVRATLPMPTPKPVTQNAPAMNRGLVDSVNAMPANISNLVSNGSRTPAPSISNPTNSPYNGSATPPIFGIAQSIADYIASGNRKPNPANVNAVQKVTPALDMEGIIPKTLIGNLNSQPLPASTPIANIAKAKPPATTKSPSNAVKKPTASPVATPQPAPQAQAAEAQSIDPLQAYKARTGIDLNALQNSSLETNLGSTAAPYKGTGEDSITNEAQGLLIQAQNKKLMNDFYASPEGQQQLAQQAALDAQDPNAGIVQVNRGGVDSFEDMRNGGTGAISDYAKGKAALDSALLLPVGAPMTNAQAQAIKLLEAKTKLTSEEAQTQTKAKADLGVASINHADEKVKTGFLQEYLNPKTTPERRAQLAPLFESKDKFLTVDGGQGVDPETGLAIKEPSKVFDTGSRSFIRDTNNPSTKAKPSLMEFIGQAKAVNPTASEAELTIYYNNKYGK